MEEKENEEWAKKKQKGRSGGRKSNESRGRKKPGKIKNKAIEHNQQTITELITNNHIFQSLSITHTQIG